MLAAIRHRGPDDQGEEALGPLAIGMRRLSILDPTPAGRQPMSSPDGRYVIVHNGEIYNFQELAAELETAGCRFSTATDTEVILAAFATWGPSCVKRFNGIWAFALCDRKSQTLFLSRDRFGVKPLFLTDRGGRIAFASEIKALLALPWVDRRPDAGIVRDFLADNLVDHTDRTFFEAIRRLPAAHNLIIGPDRVPRLERYWGPPSLSEDASMRPSPSDASRLEEIRGLLIDAVALQLRSDVPVGSCLSGGLDSSGIVSIAAALRDGRLAVGAEHLRDRERQPQLAFFAEFHEEGIDERQFVDEVVHATGIALRTTSPSADDFAASIDAIVHAQDEPFGSTSIVAQYHVMRIAHEAGVKVLLDGQGADETFAGYPHYLGMALAGAIRGGDRRALRSAVRAISARRSLVTQTVGHLVLAGRPVPHRLRRDRIPDRWLGNVTRRARSADSPIELQAGTPLARGLWRQIASEHLPALLRYEDRNSMAFGIEARVPFLDHRLVEAALLLPDRLKVMPDGGRKVALLRAMQGLVPDAVLRRRDKVAFQTPERSWIAHWPGPATSHAVAAGLLAPQALSSALADRHRDRPRQAWRMISVEAWLAATNPAAS